MNYCCKTTHTHTHTHTYIYADANTFTIFPAYNTHIFLLNYYIPVSHSVPFADALIIGLRSEV